jgi:hypothetical protein
MKERILFSLSILIGISIMLIPYLQIARAACDSFGVQRPWGPKEAPAFSLKELDGKQILNDLGPSRRCRNPII